MKNFIIRAITGIFFVAAIVVSFINPLAMTFLFAIVTGLTIWEFTGLVNERDGVDTNRLICTVAGVYFFIAVIGFCSELTPSTVFIPYLITVVYLMITELYAKNPDPIHTWAYTMMSQMYIALPFSMLGVLAFRGSHEGVVYSWVAPLSVFVFFGSMTLEPISVVRCLVSINCFHVSVQERVGKVLSVVSCLCLP